ncbi:MAG TPA: PAS domain S-box protein [Candidatus Sulfotelmatobacter sp.]|jgi:PAS domain S-box-containing protein|nr:PAS domain S-box protein [Candidatus Sulfotelmatobacter sp.]
MREPKSISARRPAAASGRKTAGRPKHDYSKELMELVVEAANSRVLPEFLRGFAQRSAEMLDTEWACVGEIVGSRVEIYSRRPDYPINEKEREWLVQGLQQKRPGLEVLPLKRTGQHVAFYPIYASDGELMGTLCLIRKAAGFSRAEQKLLAALASHAALSMEKVRRFSQLERSKKQWVEDIDAISDYIAVHDHAWKIVRTNRSLATELGIPPAALVGEPISGLRHIAETGSALPCPFCRDTREAREEYIATSAGRTFLVSTSRTRGATEEESRTIHVLKDITDRREAERRYRELFDSIQEGLFFATPEGQFLDVNDALVRMLGYESAEELLRADVSSHLYPTPAAKARLVSAIAERGALRNYEETLRKKDGGLLHTMQNISAVRDAPGNVVQIRGLMLDVTEQKMFQSQLQRERDFNQKILNTTQSMILVLDTAGLISYANRRCYEAGYRKAELIGHRLVEWVEGSHQKDFEGALQTTAHGQQVDNLELRARRADGSLGHFSISLSPMRDEANQVNSVVVVMTDITDAALLQAKLAHAEKMATIGRLVSGVAHEVNNPLAAILGFTDLLLENPEMPAAAREDLQIILQETQRTKEIVQDLLSFARQRPAQKEPVNVNAVLRQTIKLRSYDFSSHGVEVSEDFEANLSPTLGDAQQLQQVFLNILNNAYDAIQESGNHGRIRIRTRRAEDDIEVAFIDNGTGVVDPERIFDPFFTTKQAGKGTGLGLSICYGIVRGHGGEILCWNNEGESGSTFVVRLPAATETSLAAAVKEAGR